MTVDQLTAWMSHRPRAKPTGKENGRGSRAREKGEKVVMRRAGIFRVRARVGLEKVGFGLKSGSGLH